MLYGVIKHWEEELPKDNHQSWFHSFWKCERPSQIILSQGSQHIPSVRHSQKTAIWDRSAKDVKYQGTFWKDKIKERKDSGNNWERSSDYEQ